MKAQVYYHNPYCKCGGEMVKVSDQISPCNGLSGQCHLQRFCCKTCKSTVELLCYPKIERPFPQNLKLYQVTDRVAYLPVFQSPTKTSPTH